MTSGGQGAGDKGHKRSLSGGGVDAERADEDSAALPLPPTEEEGQRALSAAVRSLPVDQLLRFKFFFDAATGGDAGATQSSLPTGANGVRLAKYAIASDDAALLDFLLAHGLACDTALHVAAKCGHSDCVERMLRRGAAVDAQDKHGETALHMAAERGHLAAVRVLLEWGASVTVLSGDGAGSLSALQVAEESCREAIIQTRRRVKLV